MSNPLSTEEVRILRAAEAGRLGMNESGRYVIAGEPRPERKARERLMYQSDLLTWRSRPPGLVLTGEGRAYLARLDAEAPSS
jgi:hypothetical protein